MSHAKTLHDLAFTDTGPPLYAHEVEAVTAAINALEQLPELYKLVNAMREAARDNDMASIELMLKHCGVP
jgi:hypothetical protein